MNCLYPIKVPNKRYGLKGQFKYNVVPCGKCEACLKRKQQEWFVRLKLQQNYSDYCFFVTLTYNDEHLPPGANVSKKDIQLYHKRLRQLIKYKFSYFLTSEYGPTFQRPHYHAIYFNIRPCDLIYIEKAWSSGFVTVSEITDARLRYVCGYVVEKNFIPDGREPVFNLISKGLAKEYINKVGKYHDRIDRMYIPLYDSKFVMPRYLKEKLYNSGQRKLYCEQCIKEAEDRVNYEIERVGKDKYYNSASIQRSAFIEKVNSIHKNKKGF